MGSGCTDHPCLDIGCEEHNTLHRRIMMPIDHLNLVRGEFNGVALMKAYKVQASESHGSVRSPPRDKACRMCA
ncbi:hypothetical protein CHARACLAT_010739 [Characodon lateralis]|uniref:Uncharacterized protein n=1 Tax=Characodon lateralis TaxID=208331 RepID=A0ABU7EU74_9TELE|nr:hypothetical protein [Characodon lateralis]